MNSRLDNILVIFGVIIILGIGIFVFSFGLTADNQIEITQKAIDTNNSYLCDELPSENSTINSRKTCYTAFAIEKHDATLCEKGYGYSCYIGVMQKYPNVTICDSLKENERLNNNYAQIKSEECYGEFRKFMINSTNCQRINNEDLKTSCFNYFNK
ncbi:MAG: hypothetical protein Q7R87_03480 [Nanoarchaeota archaeon]|nr:hypothetical protein [Nanoarchaeota archaeon]